MRNTGDDWGSATPRSSKIAPLSIPHSTPMAQRPAEIVSRKAKVKAGKVTPDPAWRDREIEAPHFKSEKLFQAAVVKLAKACGWKEVYHTHNSQRSEPGFPDLVMIRDRLVVAELKIGTNKLSADQERWIESFRRVGVSAFVWRPGDWIQIETTLRGIK